MPTVAPRPKIAAGPKREVYDVIVVGGQLGGAIAAALLCKRNYRVLLVEHDGIGQGYEHDGFLLPYSPFIAPPLKAMPEVEELFNELGIGTTIHRAFKPHSPPLQLLLPQHRIDLHTDDAKRLRELKRELDGDAAAVDGALKAASHQHEQTDAFFKQHPNLPPDGFFEAWGLKSLIGKHPGLNAEPAIPKGEGAAELLRKFAGFLHYAVAEEDTPSLASVRPLSQALKLPHKFPGGREGLRELLLRRVQELGGDVIGAEPGEGSVVEELSFEGSKLIGIKLVKSDTLYRASCIVAATDAAALRRLVSDKKKQRKLTEALDVADTRELLFPVNWVVPTSALPLGMGDLLLVDTGEAELNPILIQVLPARRPGGKGEDEDARTVCAAAFVPATDRELGEEHMKGLAARLEERLDELLPFAKERLLTRSAPYLDAGGVRGSRLQPHPHIHVGEEQLLGITGLRQRTPVKNLILASREVLPGLGLEGELLAGVRGAKLVQETLKKKDPLKG